MTAVAHLNSLYAAAPIILWVEDTITRDYLGEVWDSPIEIAFLIAGGKDPILPIVTSARSEGIKHVFGLVDRDFGTTNITKWSIPGTPQFRLPRHEIENYLLDADAILNCGLNTQRRSQGDIDGELDRLAGLQPAWLACRMVLTEMRRDIQSTFPQHPGVGQIPSKIDAETYIQSSHWYGQVVVEATRWTTAPSVATAIVAAELLYQKKLANGEWRIDFSGKEIMRPLRDYVYQPGATGNHDSDFARAIGLWQRTNNKIPPDLIDLRSALRTQVGLPP